MGSIASLLSKLNLWELNRIMGSPVGLTVTLTMNDASPAGGEGLGLVVPVRIG